MAYKLYAKEYNEDADNRKALAFLLRRELVFPNSIAYGDKRCITLYVLCNDLFAWAMADAEDFHDGDIKDIYLAYRAHDELGVMRWCCIHRNEQPQRPFVEEMKQAGVWDDVLAALPENHYDAAWRKRREEQAHG